MGLYGTGALLIREFCVVFRKGWASVLLLGAAYGIAEEGFAVHTFFEPSGQPVGILSSYGHAVGVNWLWAFGLTTFHATYSIALPILLTALWFPAAKDLRWFGRRGWALVGAVYIAVVLLLDRAVGFGPSPGAFLFFLAVSVLLVGLAWRVPASFLHLRGGRPRLGPLGITLSGTLEWDAWITVLILSANGTVPAFVAAGVVLVANLGALGLILTRIGTDHLVWAEYYFAVGMLGPLFLWDVFVEAAVPGILGVAAVFAYLLYRLHGTLARRLRPWDVAPPPVGAVGL